MPDTIHCFVFLSYLLCIALHNPEMGEVVFYCLWFDLLIGSYIDIKHLRKALFCIYLLKIVAACLDKKQK